MHLDAISSHHLSGNTGKFCTAVARIVGNGNGRTLRNGLKHVVCQPLGCLSDRVRIHAVGANPHQAAQSAGPKFQIGVKGLNEGITAYLKQCFGLCLCR